MSLLKTSLLAFACLLLSPTVYAAENWKGKAQIPPFEAGLMTGFAIYGSSTNWGVLASGAFLINDQGFADEVDDRLWIEVQAGPVFFGTATSSQTGLQYSTHLRWDFTMNEYWTFYGLGGLGGYSLPSSMGNSFTIHPRFGAGAEYQTKTALLFRGEVSAEFIGMGIAFNF